MTLAPWHVCVLIPARNEEALLSRCLRSVINACKQLPDACTYQVVVVADACSDHTFEIATLMLAGYGIVVTAEEANVGGARMRAANIALGYLPDVLSRCWLANTDADCIVPANWLTDQLVMAEQGVQAVAGIIDIDSFEEHAPHVPERFRLTYIQNSDGTHPHVHGANLGVRADAYLQAGGWRPLLTAEDHDLWHRLMKKNMTMISNTKLYVVTSGRRMGRAPNGFADTLAAHNEYAYV
jgi:glycosyltransferase involved in cell wall biosynthesis